MTLGQIHGILDNIILYRTEQDVSYPTVITQLTSCSVLHSTFSNTSVVQPGFVSYQAESTVPVNPRGYKIRPDHQGNAGGDCSYLDENLEASPYFPPQMTVR